MSVLEVGARLPLLRSIGGWTLDYLHLDIVHGVGGFSSWLPALDVWIDTWPDCLKTQTSISE
jgi:hypothetical protein